MRRLALSFALGVFSLAAAGPAPAVTITIVNKDPSGTGLNDQTPVTPPVGGNPGTTIGQQRLNVFREAARIWGQILPGNVEIKVDASFTTLDCTANSAVLGGTSPTYVEADFTSAPVAGTWYVVAEANQLADEDLEAGQSHLSAQFNSNLGQSGCFAGHGFYYGFDTNTPSGDVNFLTVALHEFAHGFGFISLADESTGKLCCAPTLLPDIFDAFVYDTTKAKSWNQMTLDADRQASAINTGNLVWNGPAANAAGAAYLGMPFLNVTAPSAAAGKLTVGTADFGAKLTQAGVFGTLVAATDPSDPNGPLTTDGCSPLTNASAVAGKIALVDRGTCNFTQKGEIVQSAGANGMVVANNVSGPPLGLGGTDPSITIPVVEVSQTDGAKLRANLPAQVRIGLDPTVKSGMNSNGQLLLYAPNPVEPGSSVSHWDTSAYPDLLMEPNINEDLPIGVDITPAALRDIGWFGAAPTSPTSYYLPSVAHSAGGTPTAPAFYTSDLFVANEGIGPANFTLKFLGHDVDGTAGAEQSFSLGAGAAKTFPDVLGSVFGLTSGNFYGAIRIVADSTYLKISSVTTTPTPDHTGAYGQSVPALPTPQLITAAAPAAIVGIREDSVARTNLVLVNATEQPLDVTLALYADSGNNLGTLTQSLAPLEMTQLNHAITKYLHAGSVSSATLILSTPTAGGAFTAFASLVDNGTNDPATLLPSVAVGSGTTQFIVPAVARSVGAGNTYFTSDLFISNVGGDPANVTLQYLAFGTPDGSTGPTRGYTLNAQAAETFRDVLGSVFGLATNADKGAILVTSSTSNLAIDSVTTTPAPAGAGRFGQSVPGLASGQWIRPGARAAIVGVREDDTARTNLVLVNGPPDAAVPPYTIDVSYALYADDGTLLGTMQTATLAPLGMTQLNHVLTNYLGAPSGSSGTLVVWTTTPGATFTAFASLLNNVTSDPATLLPQ